MTRKPFAAALATLLILTASSAFFIAPQKTSAQGVGSSVATTGAVGAVRCYLGSKASGIVSGLAGGATSVPVFDAANLAQNTTAAGSTLQSCMYNTILIPVVRAIARGILQQITASTINWINGSNGTGQPSYVPNLSVHLQLVGDSVALPLIAQMATAFNSPFGSAIARSLQNHYNHQTSVAGFYAANQCTLPGTPQSQQAFLAGNWSQGGVGSWLALTTTQSNPYLLSQAAQRQLGSSVNQAQANRRQDLIQSGGFLSWCGASSARNVLKDLSGNPTGTAATCISNGVQQAFQTPGSVIAGYTQKAVVGSGIDQLVSVQDIDGALSAIVTALIGQVLGGNNGLLGASQPSVSSRPLTTQLQNYSAGNTTASASAASIAQTTLTNITNYTSAWQTVVNAANTASTSVASLASFCTSAATASSTATSSPQIIAFISAATAQAAAAQAVIPTEITPLITQAQTAINSVASSQAFALKVQAEAASASSITAGTSASAVTLVTDTQTLVTMPPSTTDVSNAQQNATVFGGARASPAGSLTVSGGTPIDQMNLINTNATALRSVCVAPAPSGG
ncbi:MAG: hypothetical protein ACYC6X_01650 [Minisyncoccota bacterium]